VPEAVVPPSPTVSDRVPRPRRAARALALGAVLLWVLLMSAVCAVKFHYFLYTDFDLAIFAQAVFGMLRGSWFSSIRGMYWLGDHSSLVLLPFAPVAALVRHPLLLVFAQVVALGAGAWPLFAYARRRLGDEGLAAGFAVLWVLQPSLGYLATYEFHPETLAVPALLGVVLCLERRRTKAALLWALLAATTKEDVALPLLVLGAVALLTPRSPGRRAGAGLVALAVASLVFSFGLLKPALNQAGAQYGDLYVAWGDTPRAMISTLLAHPLRALSAFVQTPGDPTDTLYKQRYWLELLLPVLGLALLAPLRLLPTLPILAEHFLSWRHEQHQIIYQYTALVLPFLALGTVDAFARLTAASRARPGPTRLPGYVLAALLAAALGGQALFGPLAPPSPLRLTQPSQRVLPNARARALADYRRRLQRELPARGAVVADFPSLAPLASRDSLYSLHHVVRGMFTFSSRPYPMPRNVRALLVDVGAHETIGRLDPEGCAQLVRLARASDLRVVDAAGDLLLLTSSPADTLAWLVPVVPDTGSAIRFDGALELLGTRLAAPASRPGDLLPLATRWRRAAQLPGQPQVEFLLTGPGRRVLGSRPRLLGYGFSPVAGWPPGAAYEERYRFVVPGGLAPGAYALAMRLSWRRGERATPAVTTDPGVRDAGGVVRIGTFRVAPR
jgi:uncharacterized membrane protein